MALIHADVWSEVEYRRQEMERIHSTVEGLMQAGHDINIARAKALEVMHQLTPGEIIDLYLEGKISREDTIRGIIANGPLDDTHSNLVFIEACIVGQAVRWGNK